MTFTLDVPVAKALKENEDNQSQAVNELLKDHYDL